MLVLLAAAGLLGAPGIPGTPGGLAAAAEPGATAAAAEPGATAAAGATPAAGATAAKAAAAETAATAAEERTAAAERERTRTAEQAGATAGAQERTAAGMRERTAAAAQAGTAAGMRERAALRGTVVDGERGTPVTMATVVLRPVGEGSADGTGSASSRTAVRTGSAGSAGSTGSTAAAGTGDAIAHGGAGSAWTRRMTTGADGAYRFDGLGQGRYRLTVERAGYRTQTLEVALERDEPLVVSIRMAPLPFPLAAFASRVYGVRGPSLVPPPREPEEGRPGWRPARAEAVGARQRRFLSADARQVSHADLREANTLIEHDLFRALQRLPGVGSRDDFGADLWTRGAPAGQTAVLFDGIPLVGGLHALGMFGGLNPDMLAEASFQPGVAGASHQGAGAGLVEVTTRSRGDRDAAAAAVSPLTARFVVDGRPSERLGWAVGARRSHVDALPLLAPLLGSGTGPGAGPVPYAFGDVTARADLALGPGTRVEASVFGQHDRLFGDIEGVAYGNEGDWGTLAARGTLLSVRGNLLVRHTLGLSDFSAAVATTPSLPEGRTPLHPATDHRYRTLVWESRVDAYPAPGRTWSAGVRATREKHDYDGPAIDLARLLSPEELARRGIPELTPVIAELERGRLRTRDGMTRIAAWAEGRHRLAPRLEIEAGLRLETGSRVGESVVRAAPRIRVRWGRPGPGTGRAGEDAGEGAREELGPPVTLTAAYGRSYQYLQSVARTDVVRPGLRASEVLAQAGPDTPALMSDVVTLGGEAWSGTAWLFGATLWGRATSGALLPDPTPGVIDEERHPLPATGRAWGVELSARKLAGRVRGFANYSLSRSLHRVGSRSFDASEDRRHMANMGVEADVLRPWSVGATVRALSGAPYTRITLIDGECGLGTNCTGRAPVLVGSPGLQRTPAYLGVDLMTEWTHGFDGWSLSVYGQLRNALGHANAVAYHSSCVCSAGGVGKASLGDRFDRGLPRLPVLGVRARFR